MYRASSQGISETSVMSSPKHYVHGRPWQRPWRCGEINLIGPLQFLLSPLFLGIKSIAERLRGTLLDALFASRDMALLAKRFDTALNNMPHGLCMFDSRYRIVVANQKLNQQMGLPPDFELKGSSLRHVVECGIKAGLISKSNAHILING